MITLHKEHFIPLSLKLGLLIRRYPNKELYFYTYPDGTPSFSPYAPEENPFSISHTQAILFRSCLQKNNLFCVRIDTETKTIDLCETDGEAKLTIKGE